MKLSYEKVFNCSHVLSFIPLKNKDKELSKEMKAHVMIASIELDKAIKEFEEDSKKHVESIKKEGYDQRAAQNARLVELEKKESDKKEKEPLYDEEKKELAKLKKEFDKKAFDEETNEIKEQNKEFRKEHAKDETHVKFREFTEQDYAEIVDVMFENDIELTNGGKIPWQSIVSSFYSLFIS